MSNNFQLHNHFVTQHNEQECNDQCVLTKEVNISLSKLNLTLPILLVKQ